MAEPAPSGSPVALSALYQCADITTESERLTCYDNAVRGLRTAQSEGQFVAVDRAQAAEVQRDSFGLSVPALVRLFQGGEHRFEPVETAEMQIDRIGGAGGGKSRFYMNNSQVWVTVDAVSVRGVREGETVTIHQAAFGSYMLSPPRGGQGIRVRRES